MTPKTAQRMEIDERFKKAELMPDPSRVTSSDLKTAPVMLLSSLFTAPTTVLVIKKIKKRVQHVRIVIGID